MKHLLHRLVVTHWRSTHYNQVCLRCNRFPTNDISVRCHVIFPANWNVTGCSWARLSPSGTSGTWSTDVLAKCFCSLFICSKTVFVVLSYLWQSRNSFIPLSVFKGMKRLKRKKINAVGVNGNAAVTKGKSANSCRAGVWSTVQEI